MPDDSTLAAARLAATAASVGGAARIALALHGGTRGLRLAVEGFVGATLGVTAAGLAAWVDPSLLEAGARLFVISGVAGAAGALGTRALDILQAALERRLG